jgi:beta-lactam-binding protein with PASTA domain
MRKILNRTLSLVLAAAMTVTSCDITAFAANPDVITEDSVIDASKAKAEAAEAELKEKLKNSVDEAKYPGGVF